MATGRPEGTLMEKGEEAISVREPSEAMEKTATAVTKVAPLKGKVNLIIANTNNDPTDQINSLNQIILKKPAAIMVDASSPTALNATIERACAEGIKVVSFDNPVTAPCALKVGTNFSVSGKIGAEWLAKTLHGHGQIAMDTGLAGAPAPQAAYPVVSNSKSRNLLDVHGLSPAFMRSGGIEKVARDWRKTSQEGKIT